MTLNGLETEAACGMEADGNMADVVLLKVNEGAAEVDTEGVGVTGVGVAVGEVTPTSLEKEEVSEPDVILLKVNVGAAEVDTDGVGVTEAGGALDEVTPTCLETEGADVVLLKVNEGAAETADDTGFCEDDVKACVVD